MKNFAGLLLFICFTFFQLNAQALDLPSIELPMRDYAEIEIPAGTFIPVMNTQEISTEHCQEGYKVKFICTNDLFLYDTKIIPEETVFYGYIEQIHEPVVGTNASMKIRINKLVLQDGYELPIKGYIYTTNDNIIGGGISEPLTYRKMPQYSQRAKGKATIQIRPSMERKMGTHTTVATGANLIIILTSPAYITHTLTN